MLVIRVLPLLLGKNLGEIREILANAITLYCSTEVAAYLVGKCDSQLLVDQTKLYYFYGPTYDDHRPYDYNELGEIVKHANYDINKTTVLYIHSYYESSQNATVRMIVDAYNERSEHNLVALDWSSFSKDTSFIHAAAKAKSVSRNLFVVLIPQG